MPTASEPESPSLFPGTLKARSVTTRFKGSASSRLGWRCWANSDSWRASTYAAAQISPLNFMCFISAPISSKVRFPNH